MSEDGAVTTVGWTVEVRCDEPESKSGREKTAHEHAARILIVEDEYFIAMEIEDAVRRAGHAIVGMTGSAEDAVALAEEEKPDLVLMDIRLASKRDGIDAAVELRRRFDIPCIIVSAHIDAATRQRALPAQPLGFVDKPISRRVLTSAIASALRNKP